MIYHYTSIKTLELILASKKIRFNNLNDVDDILEGSHFKKRNLAQHIFVSSWTKASDESIPLWKMYTNGNGVRIGLHDYPWKKNKLDPQEWKSKGINAGFTHNVQYHLPFNFDEIFSDTYMICPPYFTPMPNSFAFAKEIEYLDAISLAAKYVDLYKEEIDKGKGTFEISMKADEFGKYKHKSWAFQEEYRFVLFLCPLYQKPNFFQTSVHDVMLNAFRDFILYEKESQIKDFFVTLSDDAIIDMEITVGPLASEAEERIVKQLLEEYGVNNPLSKSSIAIRK